MCGTTHQIEIFKIRNKVMSHGDLSDEDTSVDLSHPITERQFFDEQQCLGTAVPNSRIAVDSILAAFSFPFIQRPAVTAVLALFVDDLIWGGCLNRGRSLCNDGCY